VATANPATTIAEARIKGMPRMDAPSRNLIVPISSHPPPARNGDFPWIDRVKCPILACEAFFSTKSASKYAEGVEQLAAGP
jgi:hypothetical protein